MMALAHSSLTKTLLNSFTVASLLLLLAEQGFCEDGYWSTAAINLSFSVGTASNPGKRNMVILSPDRKKTIIVSEYGLDVKVGKKVITGPDTNTFEIGVSNIAELSWSPDSRAFFITQSDGGLVGTYDVNVYMLEQSKLVRVDASSAVRNDFMKRYNCDVWGDNKGNEIPNIAGISWLNGSNEILLIGEVPPHSSCPEMGKFIGYVVSVPSGKIATKYNARDVKVRWGKSLGDRHNNDERYESSIDKLSPWRDDHTNKDKEK